MSKRQVKEFRPEEALSLIAADRDGGDLACPCCGSDTVERNPPRERDANESPGRIQLACGSCGRHAGYVTTAVRSAAAGPP